MLILKPCVGVSVPTAWLKEFQCETGRSFTCLMPVVTGFLDLLFKFVLCTHNGDLSCLRIPSSLNNNHAAACDVQLSMQRQ